jgi:hypothetical protein
MFGSRRFRCRLWGNTTVAWAESSIGASRAGLRIHKPSVRQMAGSIAGAPRAGGATRPSDSCPTPPDYGGAESAADRSVVVLLSYRCHSGFEPGVT